MKLSVIVPTYNRERYVRSALRSLLRQRHEVDLDIVVVDDGSTDGTTEIVQSLMRDAPEIRLFTQPNQGVSAARNLGLRQMLPATDFISFLDSDDISPEGRFKWDLKAFVDDPTLELSYSWMQMVDLLDEENLIPAADLLDEENLIPAADCREITYRGVQVGAGIYRRELVTAVGEFDEGLRQAEDLDFLFRVFERHPRHHFPDTIGLYYRKHLDSLTARRSEGHRAILRACHKALMRRKRDPSLGTMHHLIQADPRYKGVAA
jgi:glycosyltransferase involved in cell wall biosynthesis